MLAQRVGPLSKRKRSDLLLFENQNNEGEELMTDEQIMEKVIEILRGYVKDPSLLEKATMETYWIPGVNNHGCYGRWAFAEFTDAYRIEADFKAKVEAEFNKMIDQITAVKV